MVPDTSVAKTYEATDPTGDNRWPSLEPDKSSNFDLVKAKVITPAARETPTPPGPDDQVGPRRPTSATGLVSDTAGRPIEGAVVTVRFSPTEAIHGVTGADGRYMTGATYLYKQTGATITAKARDYQEIGSSDLVETGPNTLNFTLTPKPIAFSLSGPFEIGSATDYQYTLSVKNSSPAAETVSVTVTAEENSNISQATGAQLDATNQVATWTNLSVAQNSKSSQTFSLQPVISATDPQPPKISVEVTKADGSTLKQEYAFTLTKPAVTFFGGLHVIPDDTQNFQFSGWVVQSRPMDWLEGASVKVKVHCPDGTESGWLTCTEEHRRIVPTIEILVPDFVKNQYPSQAPAKAAEPEEMTADSKGTLWWPMYCVNVQNKGTGLYKFEVSSTPAGEYIPSTGTCHSRIGVKDVFEVKDADVLQIEDVEYAGQDTYNLVIRNISENCYRVILPDGRSRMLLRKDTWKPTGGVQATKMHSGAAYLHRFVIEAEFSMGVYFVQSAWVLAFQEPPPHDVLEGLLKAVGKYLGKPVDAIYQMDGKKVFMAFLDIIKDRPDLLAKCVSTKVAEKLAKQATVVFNTINMAEAIIWQLNTVRTTMRASHDIITVNAGKPTVN